MMIDITKIERIKLEPGEALHVKAGVVLDKEQIGHVHSFFKEAYPGHEVIISDKATDITLTAIKDESK